MVFLGHVPMNKWILKNNFYFIYLLFNCGIILHTITVLLKVDFSVATGCTAITMVCSCAAVTMVCRLGSHC